jgi:hypothetical protein
MVVEPGVRAVTTPLLDTEAICALLEDHEVARPMMMLLLASRVTAVASVVCPTSNVLDANVTLTVATGGGRTLIVCAPFFPPMVAVIVADPVVTPVTTPAVVTVAIAGLALVHVTGRPVRTPPFASRAVAVS